MPDLELADEWRDFARGDLDSAHFLQGARPLRVEIICYHCQQAAEKALKAVLIYHEEELPYIHNTLRLWRLAFALEPTLLDLEAQSDRLRDFATTARYPNEANITERDMKQALRDAQAIVEAVEALWKEA